MDDPMMVDTTVYGWIGDGSTVCSACFGADDLPAVAEGIMVDGTVWLPIYSLEDTEPGGLSCDDGSGPCTGWIFGPDPDYCLDCDEAHWEQGATHDDGSPVERDDDGRMV